jgi:ribose 5-phosphate isomerase A
MKGQIEGAVSSSDASTEKLKSLGIPVFDLNSVVAEDINLLGGVGDADKLIGNRGDDLFAGQRRTAA